MALNRITVDAIAANAVTNIGIANGTIVTVDLADNSVTTDKLSTTGVVAATHGNASSIPAITVGADGRITEITNTAISIPSGAYVIGSNNVILTTNTQITANCIILPNTGALTVGPVIIDANTEVTVSANARWVVL
jgi:hypothetical protein